MSEREFAVRVFQARGRDGAFDARRAPRLLTELDALLEEHRACWALRSRPGGLSDSLAVFAPLRHALLRAAG